MVKLQKPDPKIIKRLIEEESSGNLKGDVVKHIEAVREGKEKAYSFESLEEAKKWLDE